MKHFTKLFTFLILGSLSLAQGMNQPEYQPELENPEPEIQATYTSLSPDNIGTINFQDINQEAPKSVLHGTRKYLYPKHPSRQVYICQDTPFFFAVINGDQMYLTTLPSDYLPLTKIDKRKEVTFYDKALFGITTQEKLQVKFFVFLRRSSQGPSEDFLRRNEDNILEPDWVDRANLEFLSFFNELIPAENFKVLWAAPNNDHHNQFLVTNKLGSQYNVDFVLDLTEGFKKLI